MSLSTGRGFATILSLAEAKQYIILVEITFGCQMGRGLGDSVKKAKGLRSTNWQLQNSHGDVKYSTGNIVNDTLMSDAKFIRMIT